MFVSSMWSAITSLQLSVSSVERIPNESIKTPANLQVRSGTIISLTNFAQPDEGDLPTIMSYLVQFRCGDPRDVLFAIASLSKMRITPDYSLSTERTSVYFTRLLLEDDHFGAWQTNVRAKLSRKQSGTVDELPSWAVDLRQNFIPHSYHWKRSTEALSMTVDTDDVLTCKIKLCGIVQELEAEGKSMTLTYGHDLSDETVEQTEPHHRLRWLWRGPVSTRINLSRLRWGNIICLVAGNTGSPYGDVAELFGLRPASEHRDAHRILSIFDPSDLVLEEGFGLPNLPLREQRSLEGLSHDTDDSPAKSLDSDTGHMAHIQHAKYCMQWAFDNQLIPLWHTTVRMC